MPPPPEPLSPAARALLGAGTAGRPHRVDDPATETPLVELTWPGIDETATVLRSARRAHERVWSRLTGAERSRHLLALARAVRDHGDELAELEGRDTGTPVRQVRDRDVPAAIRHLRHHAGWADKLAHAGYGPGSDGSGPRSLGVTVHLVPPSASVAVLVRTAAAALACANVVVLVAPEHSPLASVALAGLATAAGWPDGVLSVLVGSAALRTALLSGPDVDGVSISGSIGEVAAAQRHLVGADVSRTATVLGPAVTVVFADAPLEAAAEHVVARTVTAHQQQLGVGSRLLVAHERHDELVATLRRRLDALTVGAPSDPDTDVGPLGSVSARDGANRMVDAAVRGGARRWSAAGTPNTGAYLVPTLLEQLPPPARAQAEPAGPVIPIHVFGDLDEAVALTRPVEATPAAVVWTNSRRTARETADRLGPSTVWADPDGPTPAPAPVPLGGYLHHD